MHFYGQSHGDVMRLPIKTFWLMNDSIDRIMAQKDMRALTVAVCGQNGEAAQEHRERLVLEVGAVAKTDENQRDEKGFAELKKMADLM